MTAPRDPLAEALFAEFGWGHPRGKQSMDVLSDPDDPYWQKATDAIRAALAPRPPETAAIPPLTPAEQTHALRTALAKGFVFDRMVGSVPVFRNAPETADAGALDAAWAECDAVCTSGCHADDCEHHGHLPGRRDATPALDVERLARALGTFWPGYIAWKVWPNRKLTTEAFAAAIVERYRAAESSTREPDA